MRQIICFICTLLIASSLFETTCISSPNVFGDSIRDLQNDAIQNGTAKFGYWGTDPKKYITWSSHTNRLIPVYSFGTRGAGEGIDLNDYKGKNSPYRDSDSLQRIYGRVPSNTLNSYANYFDQTNIADIQQAGLSAGKKHIFLVVFDGLDWETTRAAAIFNSREVGCQKGRGTGLHVLDYNADNTTQFGYMVASPHSEGTRANPDTQEITSAPQIWGGYNATKAGLTPWTPGKDLLYLIAKANSGAGEHAYPDSAATATAMTTGLKTYNGAINVDTTGNRLQTIAHRAQQLGYSVGAVSSVPISHATPAAAYTHNVTRRDYQDLSRDMLGLPSIAHPQKPLPGLDVVIGGGFGVDSDNDTKNQGLNYAPGTQYIAEADVDKIDVKQGGNYVVAQRAVGVNGATELKKASEKAANLGKRLFGFYGMGKYKGHLPFQTANGDYQPAQGNRKTAEEYSQADISENPTLEQMTSAAISVLSQNDKGFWLMVEAGDVDWANHDNNIDNSIGAVLSGDAAVKSITDWVDQNSSWEESLLIVTGDHGHYLVLIQPELLIPH